VAIPIYKGKGDHMEYGLYRRIKLLEYAMKVVERAFEHRIRQQIEIDCIQFGFMKGKGMTNAIFVLKQMQLERGPMPNVMGPPAEHRWCPLFNAAKFG